MNFNEKVEKVFTSLIQYSFCFMGLLPGIAFYHCHQKKNSRQLNAVPLGLLLLTYAIPLG